MTLHDKSDALTAEMMAIGAEQGSAIHPSADEGEDGIEDREREHDEGCQQPFRLFLGEENDEGGERRDWDSFGSVTRGWGWNRRACPRG